MVDANGVVYTTAPSSSNVTTYINDGLITQAANSSSSNYSCVQKTSSASSDSCIPLPGSSSSASSASAAKAPTPAGTGFGDFSAGIVQNLLGVAGSSRRPSREFAARL